MEENVIVPSPASSIITERGLNSQIIEEGPRICPLCSSEINLFFVSMNEKFLMCENTECEFPFGYEELQFVQTDNDVEMTDLVSVPSQTRTTSPSSSIVSSSAWSEIDRFNRVYESEDSQSDPKMLNVRAKPFKKDKKIVISEREIQKNVKDLKGLSMELNNMATSSKIIKNQKWIKTLAHLQHRSGLQLLKPQEINHMHQNDNPPLDSDLKIDIEPGNSGCISTINIMITKQEPPVCPSEVAE